MNLSMKHTHREQTERERERGMSLRRGKGTGNVSSPAGPCRFDSIVFERKQRRRRKSLKPISMLFFLAASFIIRVSSKAKTRFSAFKPYNKRRTERPSQTLQLHNGVSFLVPPCTVFKGSILQTRRWESHFGPSSTQRLALNKTKRTQGKHILVRQISRQSAN